MQRQAARAEGGQAFAAVAAVNVEVFLGEAIEKLLFVGREDALFVKDVAERFRFVEMPRLHGDGDVFARHEIELHGQPAEDKSQVGIVGNHRTPRRIAGREWSGGIRTYRRGNGPRGAVARGRTQ